ncbi:MAG: ABC transporter ATP-binding protein [Deltaproteobacteria bacterium]|nr:ABC transporter ATP-binding protein [Deltaproteobacteria bacterium]
MATSALTSLTRLRRLTPFVAPFFARLALVFALSLFGATVGLLWPLFTKVLIDNVLLAKNIRLLLVLCGVMVGTTVVGYGVGAVTRYFYTQVTARILFALRQHLFAHLQGLSLRFHARVKLGDLLSRLNTDISEVQVVLTDTAFALVSNLLMLLVTIGFLLWLEWRLFLLSLVAVPFQLYGVMKIRPRMVEQTREVRELNATLSSFLVESLSSMKFIKLFTLERTQLQRLGALGERFVRTVTRFEMLGYWGGSVSSAATFFGGVLTTLYGGYLVIDDQLTVGALVAFSAYQSRAFSPLQALVDLYLRFERAGVSLDRIFEFLDVAGGNSEPQSGSRRLDQVRGEVEFRGVSFAYETAEPLLLDVSFRVPAGGRLTILGPSGAGKSTVVDLLARLYEPRGGSILLDGHPLPEFDLTWLRSQITVVEHEPVLFHSSIMENLRYASPEVSVAEVEAVARIVGLHEFLDSLPQGYDTVVGERGARLSTGQRQRIALARALLRRPRILVLDEALSGLDLASEAQVRAALDALMKDTTVLLVTHRHSSLHGDDLVLVLDHGRVMWQGVYGALPSTAGTLYVTIEEWERQPTPQSGGFLVQP